MADNLTLNAGSGGQTAATDEVSGVHFQRVKLTPGGSDVAQYGATNYRYRSAASSNQDSQLVKGSAGVLYGLTATNTASSVRYLRLYNHVDAPVAGDSADLFRTYAIPANGGIREQFPYGVLFGTGLGLRMTTDEGDAETTPVTAGDVHLMIEYA
jgi:hypothetical protein